VSHLRLLRERRPREKAGGAVAVVVAVVGADVPSLSRQIEVDVTPGQMMATIVDFSSYPSFLPETQQTEVVLRESAAWEVRFTVRVIRSLQYTLRLEQDGDRTLRWSLVEGVFASNDGSWTLEPLDGGTRTRATYGIDVQVGMYVPGNIIRSLVETALPRTLERFKAEAERRALA